MWLGKQQSSLYNRTKYKSVYINTPKTLLTSELYGEECDHFKLELIGRCLYRLQLKGCR